MSKCNGCKCQDVGCGTEHCDDLHKLNDEKIERAGKVIKDAEVCTLPTVISKGVENIWCVFKNIIHNICCLDNRMDCVEEKEKRIGRGIECIDPRITTLNMMLNYINSGRMIDNQKLQAELEAWQQQVAEVQEHNSQEEARYISEYNQYQQDLATSKAQIHTDGYPSQVITQEFHLSGGGSIKEILSDDIVKIPNNDIVGYTSELWQRSNWGQADVVNVLGSVGNDANIFIIPLNKSLKIRTTLPSDVYYRNEYAKEAEITFTNLASAVTGGNTYISLYAYDSLSFNYIAQKGSTHMGDFSDLKIEIKLFNEAGNQITIGDNAYMALNSLNCAGDSSYLTVEWAQSPSYVYITGSSIHQQSTGRAHANEHNDNVDWDGNNNSRNWYGAIIGNVSNSNPITIHFGCSNKNWAWYKADTNIHATVVPKMPAPINKLPIPSKPAGDFQDLLDFSDGTNCLDLLDDPDSCINAHTERNPKHTIH